MKALIVDDEEDIGRLMSNFLKKENVDTFYVSRVELAKKVIEKENYDVFFLDLNLPDGSGFDLIPSIRKYGAKSYIVVISAYVGNEEVQRLKSFEVNAFVKKPFTRKQILDVLPPRH